MNLDLSLLSFGAVVVVSVVLSKISVFDLLWSSF